jgi:alkanesulfonate monooxygenase SsuD/methylene tetrahydromethanopterin reductase-like flavin-dependent oxidoreductase (luciferase family)
MVAPVSGDPPRPRLLFILSENWTLVSGRDLPELVRWARIVEDAGVDGVMLSEHVVLGPDARVNGVMGNPRDYAMPGNQDPDMPWPSSIVLLSAMAAATERVRLVAGAIIAPLRHPLLLARELGTLDLVSEGRLVVQPTVSWSRDEYEALGVPFAVRGRILDEQLEILQRAWRPGPFSHHGEFFSFDEVSVAPPAHRVDGPRLWFGGQRLRGPLLRRLVRYGHGFHPLGRPASADLTALAKAMAEAGRDVGELEFVGGARAVFPDDRSVADLGAAMDPIREQLAAGFSTFCVKPSQFIDDAADLPRFCADVVRRLDEMTG